MSSAASPHARLDISLTPTPTCVMPVPQTATVAAVRPHALNATTQHISTLVTVLSHVPQGMLQLESSASSAKLDAVSVSPQVTARLVILD